MPAGGIRPGIALQCLALSTCMPGLRTQHDATTVSNQMFGKASPSKLGFCFICNVLEAWTRQGGVHTLGCSVLSLYLTKQSSIGYATTVLHHLPCIRSWVCWTRWHTRKSVPTNPAYLL
jgi:hypothetical protein